MTTTHWEQYKSYNTTDDATTLIDIAGMLSEISDAISEDPEGVHWMSAALVGIGQRLSRLNTAYPYPDPIPEHWGPKPEGAKA